MKRTRIRPQSKKRRAENRVRSAMVKELWPEGAPCVVPWCTNRAQDPHEPLTRARGGSITEPDNVVPTCRIDNSKLTEEPAWGYALDLLIHAWDKRTYAEQAADRARKLADWRTVLDDHGIGFCPWEREYLPTDHPCVADSQPATSRRADLRRGFSCISAQAEDLTRHGSPDNAPTRRHEEHPS